MITWDDISPIGPAVRSPKTTLTEALATAKATAKDVAPYKPKATTGTEIVPVRLEQAPLTLNTAKVLDLVKRILAHWARWPDEHALNIATLWVASTWFADTDGRLLFASHPRIFLLATPGSGKTRIMKVMRAMSREPTGIVKAPVTAPGVRDALLAGRTVFLDELHRQIGRGMGHMDIQSLISAYEADTASLNGRGGYNEQSVFGPMVLAAHPRITTSTNGLIEDLLERSFLIMPEKHTDKDDRIPDLDAEFEQAVELIPYILQTWGEAVRPNSGKLWPIHDMPESLDGRGREISQALLAVADRAADPATLAAEGKDTFWAEMGRDAVQYMLLGRSGNGANMLMDLEKRLQAMGIDFSE